MLNSNGILNSEMIVVFHLIKHWYLGKFRSTSIGNKFVKIDVKSHGDDYKIQIKSGEVKVDMVRVI